MKIIESLVFATIGVALLGLSSVASAAPITVPAGLNAGDQYRIAFVTSTTRDATSADIADYNAFVTAAATAQLELNALGTTWTAIASTATVDARDNTSTIPSSVSGGSLGFPIFLLDGNKLVDSYDDLWDGTLDLPLNIDETGASNSGQIILSGTTPSGVAFIGQSLGDLSGATRTGFSTSTSGGWVNASAVLSSNQFSLYALSDVLTVQAIPEPGSLLILSIGLAGLCVVGRKRTA